MENITHNFESLSEQDMLKYAGKWIAIVESKLVISGNSFKEVYNYVKENLPNKKPLIGKLPEAVPSVFSIV